MRTRRLPRDDATCGWAALLPPPPAARPLRGATRADVAIVGAGYTGLAVARRLAEHRPDWRVVVLDAQRVGDGASGRNSGFVVDLPHADAGHDRADSLRLLRLGRAGRLRLQALVEQHGIACDWRDGGRVHGARGPVGERALAQFAAGLAALGEACDRLDAAALARVIGTDYYHRGARTHAGATVQPAALIRGLAATLPPSVAVHEASPVRGLGGDGPFVVATEHGRVDAARVVLAANGYTPGLGPLRRHILPLMTFGSLTRPLSPDEAAALGGEREWGLVSEARMGTTLRRLRDGRLLIRNTVRYTPRLGAGARLYARARACHRRDFDVRFPRLAGVPFEHTWGGVMGATFNGAQFFGALAPGLYAAAGYNGVGIAMGTTSGTLLADLIVGVDSSLLADLRALPAPRRAPPGPLAIGVRAMLAYLSRVARGE